MGNRILGRQLLQHLKHRSVCQFPLACVVSDEQSTAIQTAAAPCASGAKTCLLAINVHHRGTAWCGFLLCEVNSVDKLYTVAVTNFHRFRILKCLEFIVIQIQQ